MHSNRISFLAAALCLAVIAAGCSFPGAPTPFTIPTPNLTTTALFQPTDPIPPSATPPAVQTATPEAASQETATSPTGALPTVTSGPAVQRPGSIVEAAFLSLSPTIDGNLDDWDAEQKTAGNVVWGAGNRAGQSDLFAVWSVGWDESNLYLAAWVEDNVYAQNATGSQIYKGDSLEIVLDTNLAGDFSVAVLDSDDFQLGISPGRKAGESPQAYLWYPRAREGPRTDIQVEAAETATGYQVEVAIPWSVFDVTPANGMHFGFSFSVSDNDNTAANVQQTMVSNVSTRFWSNPTTWGTMVIVQPK